MPHQSRLKCVQLSHFESSNPSARGLLRLVLVVNRYKYRQCAHSVSFIRSFQCSKIQHGVPLLSTSGRQRLLIETPIVHLSVPALDGHSSIQRYPLPQRWSSIASTPPDLPDNYNPVSPLYISFRAGLVRLTWLDNSYGLSSSDLSDSRFRTLVYSHLSSHDNNYSLTLDAQTLLTMQVPRHVDALHLLYASAVQRGCCFVLIMSGNKVYRRLEEYADTVGKSR